MTPMALSYTTYLCELQPRHTTLLPEFAGSLVRGTFGKALRDLTCATRAATCAGCSLASSCTYREIFDPVPPRSHDLQRFSAIPAPYVLHVGDWGERRSNHAAALRFGVTLIGRARRHWSLVVAVLQHAAGTGWTRERIQLELTRVTALGASDGIVVYGQGQRTPAAHGPTAILDSLAVANAMSREETATVLTVDLRTPARLQQDGRPAQPGDLQARTWLMSVARRVGLLADFHADGPLPIDFQRLASLAAQARIVRHTLRWQEWERYSGRQKHVMPMGGLVGRLEISGPLEPFRPLLEFCAALHAGKHAAFGLGAYSLTPSDAAATAA